MAASKSCPEENQSLRLIVPGLAEINDFAFKRIFGTEQYKDATIGLLNCLFTEINIVDVSFPNTEILGDTEDSRKGFIDVLCTDVKGNQFVIEMQNARQEFFRERTIYYSSKLITGQASVGKWDLPHQTDICRRFP